MRCGLYLLLAIGCELLLAQPAELARADATVLKPPLTGLISMGRIGFVNHPGPPDNSLESIEARPETFDGVAVNITWAQLQPDGEGLDTRALDRALTAVEEYNRLHRSKPLAIRLRVFAGTNAPERIKRLGGDPIVVFNHEHEPVTVGRFWSDPYRILWRELQARLAARYDDNPLIRETSVTSCSARGDEPLILPFYRASSLVFLHRAGFTDAAYRRCLKLALDDYDAWKKTRVDFTFNPFPMTDGAPTMDRDFTLELMSEWRKKMGNRGTLMNHGLIVPLRPQLQPIFERMRALGPPFGFQMFSPETSYWPEAIDYAVTLGANSVELWPPFARFAGFAAFSVETLRMWSERLKANKSAE